MSGGGPLFDYFPDRKGDGDSVELRSRMDGWMDSLWICVLGGRVEFLLLLKKKKESWDSLMI